MCVWRSWVERRCGYSHIDGVASQGVNTGWAGDSMCHVEHSLSSSKYARAKGTFLYMCCVYAGTGQV